ncbi:unnamed protein product [Chrysoparadoxa australica]
MKAYIWTILLTLSILVGCGNTEDTTVGQIADPQVQSLVQEADELAFLMDTGRILRSASQRDKDQVRGTLERIKAASVLLDANPQNRSALSSLKTAFSFYDKIIITERDQPRVQGVFDRARNLMVKYAEIQGVKLDDLQWTLFSYRFSEGVTPFGSSDTPIQWSIRFVQQERYAINVRGENKQAVLLTPTFDLTKVTNPGYSLRHSFQVEEHFRPKPEFDRNKIMNTAFRAYVSTTYKNGDVPNFNNKRHWTRVGLGKLPVGLNFNTVESGVVPLDQFAGKKITMAFVYTNNDEIHNHQLSWAIERFELHGVGAGVPYQERPEPFDPAAQDNLGKKVWKHEFVKDTLNNLAQVTLSGAPADFRMDDERGVVSGGNINTQGEKLLFTQPIDLSEVANPFIRLKHTLNFYEGVYAERKNIALVVAEDVEGKDPKELNWIKLDFEKNNPPGSNWNAYTTEFIPVPREIAGKKIRVGFYHKSEDDSSPAWQIHFAEIKDIAELAE